MRRAARVDGNHGQIVRELRQAGATVQSMATIGNGVPDILVGWKRLNFVFEIKDGSQPACERTLTSDEVEWHFGWNGQVDVIETTDQAIKIMERQCRANSKRS